MALNLTKPDEGAVGWAVAVNQNFIDIETAINNEFVRRDGTTPLTAQWDVGAGKKIATAPDATNSGLNIGSAAADPSTLADGDTWGRAGDNQPRYRKNGATVSFETQDKKGVTNGYASLDGSTLVPVAQLGTGTADGTKFLRGDRTWAAAGGGADVTVAMGLVTAFFGMGSFGGR